MSDPENTTPEMLMQAAEIGKRNGLRYVYAGNLPGRVGDLEHTHCHHCRARVIERYGYFIQSYRITPEGACPDCGTAIPGRWGAAFDGQITSTPFLPGGRRLRIALSGYLPASTSSTAILNASYGCAPSITFAIVTLESCERLPEQEHRRAVDVHLRNPLDARLDVLRVLAGFETGAERGRVQAGILREPDQLLGGLQRRLEQLGVQVPELPLIVGAAGRLVRLGGVGMQLRDRIVDEDVAHLAGVHQL